MRELSEVTGDLCKVFEKIRALFQQWTSECPEVFIAEVQKLDALDEELEEITGDKQKAYLIRVGIYRSIFPDAPKEK